MHLCVDVRLMGIAAFAVRVQQLCVCLYIFTLPLFLHFLHTHVVRENVRGMSKSVRA